MEKKILNRLDKENHAMNLHNSEFAVTEIVWLGYNISPDGVNPTEKKSGIAQMEQHTKTAPIIHEKHTSHDQSYNKFFKHNGTAKTIAFDQLSTKNNRKGSKLKKKLK